MIIIIKKYSYIKNLKNIMKLQKVNLNLIKERW